VAEKPKLTEQDYRDKAHELDCEVATIKAVAEVESQGDGFLPTGEPVILFEAHIFDRLTKGKFRALYPNISSSRWNRELYGPTGKQHIRLAQAVSLDREAALQSASYGKFQIMGFNWKVCGYSSLQSFINAMYRSERDHLDAFIGYVMGRKLDDELRRKDWAGFAFGYNGSGYSANKYDVKLAKAYKAFGGR
jgi:hypothetical protein